MVENSLGKILKEARESKKKTVQDASRDTSIMVKYIQALEEEDWARFPGEIYLIGFLKKYAEYLGLDPEYIVELYNSQKIEETPTPLNELLIKRRSFLKEYGRSISIFLAVILLVVFVFWGGYKIFSLIRGGSEKEKISEKREEVSREEVASGKHRVKELVIKNDKGELIAYKGDTVKLIIEGNEYELKIKDIKLLEDKKGTVYAIFYPNGKNLELPVLDPVVVRYDNLPRELYFIVKGASENAVRLFVKLGKRLKPLYRPEKVDVDPTKRITCEFDFLQPSFMEVYVDGDLVFVGLVKKGEHKTWVGYEVIQVRIGNAGGVKVRINGVDYRFGNIGQTANKKIFWKKDPNDPDKLKLAITDW